MCIVIGIIAGVLALPLGIAFLASSLAHRRQYGKGLCIGFGLQWAAGIILIFFAEAFWPGITGY